MENKKITPPEGYKFEVISEAEIKLVPVETKPKYPTKISDINRKWAIEPNNSYDVIYGGCGNDHCSTQETAIKFAAMMQLVEFRDATNKIDGFVANWNSSCQTKWVIVKKENRVCIDFSYTFSHSLHFGSQETAELFLNTHRALIEQAGDLV